MWVLVPDLTKLPARRRDVAGAIGERALRAALASGLIHQPWRGVLIPAAHALDLKTRAAAAILVVREPAVLSGRTAVALHGCCAAEGQNVHLTVPYSRSVRSKPGLIVHQGCYRADEVVRIDGLPVFSFERSIADFLCDGDSWAAFASLDQSLRGLNANRLNEVRTAICQRIAERRDSRGTSKALLMAKLATGKADSPPESWFRLIVVEAGFPVPEPQHPIMTIDGKELYVLDMAWVALRIALEYDGYAAHEGRKAYDAERDDRLARRGWIVIRAGAEDLRDPSRIIGELRAAFERRSR